MEGAFSRSEESDPSGNVVGSYSFIDGEGKARSLSYKAGANIGFVPLEAEGLHPEIMASFADFGKRHSSSASTRLTPLNQRETLRRPASSSSNRRKSLSRRLALPSESSYSYPQPTEPPSLYLPPSQGNAI